LNILNFLKQFIESAADICDGNSISKIEAIHHNTRWKTRDEWMNCAIRIAFKWSSATVWIKWARTCPVYLPDEEEFDRLRWKSIDRWFTAEHKIEQQLVEEFCLDQHVLG
jgi:hypothetical protein